MRPRTSFSQTFPLFWNLRIKFHCLDPLRVDDSYDYLSSKLNYKFKNPELLELALTHRSAVSTSNERLEYLGDAILGFVIADVLFQKFAESPEGILTRKRASLVKKETLASLARQLELGEFIQLGSGERKSGGWRRDSILANTLEAIIGAIYLDGNFETSRKFIIELYKNLPDSVLTMFVPKFLQSWSLEV